MSLYDDKRFLLSHIRHSFITCDDTGMCETVMINEHSNRYPQESIYHHPFELSSDLEDNIDNFSLNSLNDFKYNNDEIELLQKTELQLQSELVDEDQQSQSLDIMSFDMETRRRSNTAMKLDRLKKETKNQSETEHIKWKTATQVVKQIQQGDSIFIKRAILDVENLPPEERALLEYDPEENIYYETEAYRKLLFPIKELEKPKQVRISIGEDEEDQESSSKEHSEDSTIKPRRKSALTLQIERSPVAPVNPFNDYARFDGRVSEDSAQTKSIRIFFNMQQNDPNSEPCDLSTEPFSSSMLGINCGPNWIEIIVLANARVCDLIGLICWHYTQLQIGPPLNPDLNCYALKIAEENGDVDNDFPSLTFTDKIKRYGFPYLALVSVETQISVTVYIDSEFSQIIVNSLRTTLKEILEQLKKKRPQLFRNKTLDQFGLERRSQPGVMLDMKSPISDHVEKNQQNKSQNLTVKFSLVNVKKDSGGSRVAFDHLSPTVEKSLTLPKSFTGIRLNKSSSALYALDHQNQNSPASIKKRHRDPNDFSTNMFDIMKAPLYQCFEVIAVTKLHHSPVEMGISETKLEISPKTTAKSPSTFFPEKLFSRFQGIKPMNINLEDVVECHFVPATKHAKQTFKIVYWNGNDFKTIKFESDHSTVDDIVFKLQHVMKMRTSLRRNEYHSILNQKKTITNKVHAKSKISSGSSESEKDDHPTIIMDDPTAIIVDDEYKSYNDFYRRKDSKFRKFLT